MDSGRPDTCSAHPDRTLALLAHNPFISGCDTLDLHGMALEIQDALNGSMTPARREALDRRVLNLLADKIVLASQAMTQAMPSLFHQKQSSGNDNDSASVLGALLTMAKAFPEAVAFRSAEDEQRLAEVRKAMANLGKSLEDRGQAQWSKQFKFLDRVLLTEPGVPQPQLALSDALSPYGPAAGGFPKLANHQALPPEAQLREGLRQIADELTLAMPASPRARRLSEILRASPETREFAGVFDPRVRWRPTLAAVTKYLGARGKHAKLASALSALQKHGFVGRSRDEKNAALKKRLLQGRTDLAESLTQLGYGYALPDATKPTNRRSA
jgi:hypothetical protein